MKKTKKEIHYDYFDDNICDVMNRYIKKGFISKNGNLFFDDDEIVADFNYHIEGLKNLIKMTYREKKWKKKWIL